MISTLGLEQLKFFCTNITEQEYIRYFHEDVCSNSVWQSRLEAMEQLAWWESWE